MRTISVLAAAILVSAVSLPSAGSATILFTSTLTGAQEAPGPGLDSASGTATLELNDTETRLTMLASLSGLDLDGLQTPGTTDDDVVAAHIHRAPTGSAGPVVWGFIGTPFNDTNPTDVVVDPLAGTVSAAWDLPEGNATTLGAELGNLLAGNLYLNFHTTAFPAGAIRGQILPATGVPEPASLALLGLAVMGLRLMRRR